MYVITGENLILSRNIYTPCMNLSFWNHFRHGCNEEWGSLTSQLFEQSLINPFRVESSVSCLEAGGL